LEAGWRQHVPAFLNAVSSVGAFGHELARVKREQEANSARLSEVRTHLDSTAAQLSESRTHIDSIAAQLSNEDRSLWDATTRTNAEIGKLWQRVEFVRTEVLYELKYGRGKDQGTARTAAKVVSPDKVERARREGTARLNLGCGHVPLEGYINVDMRELPGVDVVADAGDLPFERATLQEIFSSHTLEHFPQEALTRHLLPYWRSLLRPGGVFRAVVPDGEAMLKGVADGSMSFEDFRLVLFGAQDYDGDFHYNLMTPLSLSTLLHESGFVNIEVPVQGRRNDICFEFEITAVRPG